MFRFVHAFTGRIAALGALGSFAVDPEAHDDLTLAMVRGAFDGRVRVRTGDRGPELLVTGCPVSPRGGSRSAWRTDRGSQGGPGSAGPLCRRPGPRRIYSRPRSALEAFPARGTPLTV